MTMTLEDIERLIKEALPDAHVKFRICAATATITPRMSKARVSLARHGCSSTRWFTPPCKAASAACCTRWR